jgi:uncharacterized phage-associated protein
LYFWIKFKLKSQGKPLDHPVAEHDFFFTEGVEVNGWQKLLDHVFRLYVHETASSLVELTHMKGSPWHKAVTNNWIEIPDYVIREYYELRVRRT